MARGQRRQKPFAPYGAGMTIGKLGRARNECKIEPVGAKPHDAIAGCAFGDFHVNAWMLLPVAFDQAGEEAAGDQGVDTDAQPAMLSPRHHAGGPDGMVELFDADRHPLDEMSAGFRQPDAACVTLEQEDANVFLQSLHARADARLTDAHGIRRMAEIQILGNGQCLNQRKQRYSGA